MNATQFKKGDRVRVKIGYYDKIYIHGTVTAHKHEKKWGEWHHLIEVDDIDALVGSKGGDYYYNSFKQRLAKAVGEYNGRRIMSYTSQYVIGKVDENDDLIVTEAQKKAKDRQAKEHFNKMLTEQERMDQLAKAVVQCSALGMTAWQAKGKQGQYGKNKPVLVIGYEEIEKLLAVVTPAFEAEMGGMMGAHT